MILAAVFFLSLSALAFEVLLTRVFSISQWNHLSFMVISIALFGFAASGTFLNIIDPRKKGWEERLSSNDPIKMIIILYAVSAIGSFVVLNRIPLDYFRLPLEPIQTLYLLTDYLLLSLPFFFTGLVVSIAYAFIPEKSGLVYFASMAGSALGAIIPVLLIPSFGEGKLIIVTALIPLVMVPFGIPKPADRHDLNKGIAIGKRVCLYGSSLLIVLIASFLIVSRGGTMIEVKPSPYKALSHILEFPDTSITETVTGIRGRFDSIQSPYIRFAPGLSLKFSDVLPEKLTIFRDADNPFFLYKLQSKKDEHFSKYTLSYSGYILNPNPEHVLLIQSGGGSGIPCAMASGARNITIVEQQPQIARIIKRHYNITVKDQNPRTLLSQIDERFDIIQVENWGSSLPGSAALAQEYFFTLESFSEYLNHLTENGIIIISRKLLLPPADSIRLWAEAYESLKSLGFKNPERHLAVLRDWSTFTLIVSASPFEDMTLLKDFARNLNFDLVFIPGISRGMTNCFNIFDAPYHFLEIKRLADAYQTGTEKAFFKSYPLDVTPQTDSRPFPSRFLKWSRLKALYKISGSRFYSLFMSSEIVVAVVFLEALVVTVFLLVLPLIAINKGGQKTYVSHILYFLAVGAGFMFIELFFIKKYIFVFGDPVISFTVVLAGILVFSSFGGYCSQRIGPHNLRNVLLVLTTVLVFLFFGLDPIIHQILKLSKILRYIMTFLLLIPAGFLAGLPFPLGMRYLLNRPAQRASAWTANGCASVLTSIASAQIALGLGIPIIIVCAALAYLLAFISAKPNFS